MLKIDSFFRDDEDGRKTWIKEKDNMEEEGVSFTEEGEKNNLGIIHTKLIMQIVTATLRKWANY